MEAESQRHRPGRRCVLAGAGERLGVVVVSVHEQKLEPRTTEQSGSGATEAAPFRVARQVAEVAGGEERVAALLNGALEQVAQVASVAMQSPGRANGSFAEATAPLLICRKGPAPMYAHTSF
jgi:hypothetical protein